ncbi:MAG: hypothetical protein Q9194_004323 [Teloschistes cf. exilis]
MSIKTKFRWIQRSKPKNPPTLAVYFRLTQPAGKDNYITFWSGIWTLTDLVVTRDDLNDCPERKILDKTIQGFVEALVVEKAAPPSGIWRRKPKDKAKRALNMKTVLLNLEKLSYRNEKRHRTEAPELKDVSKMLVMGAIGVQSTVEEDDDVGCEKASMNLLTLFFEDPAKF